MFMFTDAKVVKISYITKQNDIILRYRIKVFTLLGIFAVLYIPNSQLARRSRKGMVI